MSNAKRCAKTIYKNSGHIPTIEEMSDGYAWLYLKRTEENINKYKSWFDLPADDFEKVKSSFLILSRTIRPLMSSSKNAA